jgi:hypothetical protein
MLDTSSAPRVALLLAMLGLVPAVIARRKGYSNFVLWWLAGALMFAVVTPWIVLRRPSRSRYSTCPACLSHVPREATACPCCTRDLPVAPTLAARDEPLSLDGLLDGATKLVVILAIPVLAGAGWAIYQYYTLS